MNYIIRFSISTNVPLEVDAETGVVYAPEGAFDYETNPNHTVRVREVLCCYGYGVFVFPLCLLQIVATDSRENPELSQVSSPFLVTINVVDVNDESPKLTSLNGTKVRPACLHVHCQAFIHCIALLILVLHLREHQPRWSGLLPAGRESAAAGSRLPGVGCGRWFRTHRLHRLGPDRGLVSRRNKERHFPSIFDWANILDLGSYPLCQSNASCQTSCI